MSEDFDKIAPSSFFANSLKSEAAAEISLFRVVHFPPSYGILPSFFAICLFVDRATFSNLLASPVRPQPLSPLIPSQLASLTVQRCSFCVNLLGKALGPGLPLSALIAGLETLNCSSFPMPLGAALRFTSSRCLSTSLEKASSLFSDRIRFRASSLSSFLPSLSLSFRSHLLFSNPLLYLFILRSLAQFPCERSRSKETWVFPTGIQLCLLP